MSSCVVPRAKATSFDRTIDISPFLALSLSLFLLECMARYVTHGVPSDYCEIFIPYERIRLSCVTSSQHPSGEEEVTRGAREGEKGQGNVTRRRMISLAPHETRMAVGTAPI